MNTKNRAGFASAIAIIIIFIAVIVGGYAAVHSRAKSKAVVSASPRASLTPQSPSESPLPSTSADTSTWPTYTNPTYGITMQYPAVYSKITRTNAFIAEEKPESENDLVHQGKVQVNVLLRKLDGYKTTLSEPFTV